MIGSSQSSLDGLLGRRRQRTQARRLVVAAVVAVLVAWALRNLAPRGDGDMAGVGPTDRILALRAPDWPTGENDVGAAAVDDAPIEAAVPAYVEGDLVSGQSVTAALLSQGVPQATIGPALASMEGVFDFRRAQPGHHFEAELDATGRILVLRYQTRPEVTYETRWTEAQYEARQVEVQLDVQQATLAGVVTSTFTGAITAAGEGESLARLVAGVFQWDIDFSRDTRPGDAFRVLFEKVYLDGNFLRYGRLLAAEYRGARVQAAAYYHDDDALAGYYAADGQSLQRMFLAAPCRHRRISSGFNLNRWHPVLNRRVPHLGVDYAAETGTPVYAAAEGTITYAGFNARAGNLVKIRHAREYETVYAHLSRFARGLRAGQTVEQGQTIGFVGSTGMSTGPHLHFGMKHRGQYIDPLLQESSRGPGLTGRALSDFRRRQSQLAAALQDVAIPEVALAAGEGSGTEEAFDMIEDGGADDY